MLWKSTFHLYKHFSKVLVVRTSNSKAMLWYFTDEINLINDNYKRGSHPKEYLKKLNNWWKKLTRILWCRIKWAFGQGLEQVQRPFFWKLTGIQLFSCTDSFKLIIMKQRKREHKAQLNHSQNSLWMLLRSLSKTFINK